MGCIALVRCVLVLRCGLAGVVWYPYAGFSLHPDTTHTTHDKTQQISRKLLRMDVLTFETCWALNNEIKKASDIKLVYLYLKKTRHFTRRRKCYSSRIPTTTRWLLNIYSNSSTEKISKSYPAHIFSFSLLVSSVKSVKQTAMLSHLISRLIFMLPPILCHLQDRIQSQFSRTKIIEKTTE